MRPPFERLLAAYRDKSDRLAYSFFNGKVMDSLKERNMADEYIYFDVESFHQFLEFIIGTVFNFHGKNFDSGQNKGHLRLSEQKFEPS